VLADSDSNEISTVTLRYLPGYVRNPITFMIMIDATQGLVDFRARQGYGLDEVQHKDPNQEIIQTSNPIKKERIESILETFYKSNFFSLKDRYDDYGMTDQAFVTIAAATRAGRKKEVIVYGGHIADLDDTRRFHRLFDKIIELTEVDKWLKATFDNKGTANG
jgi:hypothetical protein